MNSLEITRELCDRYALILTPPGEKGPRTKQWQNTRLSREQFDKAFASGSQPNVGIILGEVCDIECDHPESEADLIELFDGSIPITPSWRSSRGSHRLFACDQRLLGLGVAVLKWKTVEIRLGGEKAAQSLLPPSITGGFERTWIVSPGDAKPAELPSAVVQKLLAAVAEKEPCQQEASATSNKSSGNKSPGDDFCERVSWDEILQDYYVFLSLDGQYKRWQRIGGTGVTATTGCKSQHGKDLFYNFSENDPHFEARKTYDKFSVYAILNHDGDFAKAASVLAKQGYGDKVSDTASAKLIAIGEEAELFHSPEGDAFATCPVAEHHETYRIESRDFKRWLEHRYYVATRKAAAQKAMTEALGVLAAKANFEGSELSVYTRIARLEKEIYLDLCNDQWQVVKITPRGWEVINCPPHIKFRRPKGMLALPEPTGGGTIDEFRAFVNLDDRSWILYVASLLGVFSKGPYVIGLILSGHGSGKSTTMRHGRQIIDPNVADVRATPHDVEKLMLAATNGTCVCIDNADNVQAWLASALCRVSTGGGFGTRELYTNDSEHLFNVMRPIWITGITDLTEREDFLSRCVLLKCPPISDDGRREESELLAEFAHAKPRILGAILTAVSAALDNFATLPKMKLPRMADFYKWVVAAQKGLGWQEGTFENAFSESQKEINAMVLDTPVVEALIKLMQMNPTWTGTSQQLLTALTPFTSPTTSNWPKGPQVLSNRLNRLKNDLDKIGIKISQHGRVWTITL